MNISVLKLGIILLTLINCYFLTNFINLYLYCSEECRCGYSYGSYGMDSDSACSSNCAAWLASWPSKEYCGYGWRNSVYKIFQGLFKIFRK